MSKRHIHSPEFKDTFAVEVISGPKTLHEIAANGVERLMQVGL